MITKIVQVTRLHDAIVVQNISEGLPIFLHVLGGEWGEWGGDVPSPEEVGELRKTAVRFTRLAAGLGYLKRE